MERDIKQYSLFNVRLRTAVFTAGGKRYRIVDWPQGANAAQFLLFFGIRKFVFMSAASPGVFTRCAGYALHMRRLRADL